MAARPIMTAETAVVSRARCTSCGVQISPLPMTGTLARRAQWSIISQSALPPYCWERVRPWIAMACTPASWRRSTASGAQICSISQPIRILVVTGQSFPSSCTTAAAMRCNRGKSLSREEPPFLPTTLGTGQPALISRKSGCMASTMIRAAAAQCSGTEPKI